MKYNITGMNNLSGFLIITTLAVVLSVKVLTDYYYYKNKRRQKEIDDFDKLISRRSKIAELDYRQEQTRHLKLKNDTMQSKAEKKLK